MAWSGLALLLLVGLGTIATGLPAAIILLAASIFGAVLGMLTGTIELATLGRCRSG